MWLISIKRCQVVVFLSNNVKLLEKNNFNCKNSCSLHNGNGTTVDGRQMGARIGGGWRRLGDDNCGGRQEW